MQTFLNRGGLQFSSRKDMFAEYSGGGGGGRERGSTFFSLKSIWQERAMGFMSNVSLSNSSSVLLHMLLPIKLHEDPFINLS